MLTSYSSDGVLSLYVLSVYSLSTDIITMISVWLNDQIPLLQLNYIHLAWCILRAHCTELPVITIYKWCYAHFVWRKANNIEQVTIICHWIFSIMTWMPLHGATVWCEEMIYDWWVIIFMLLSLVMIINICNIRLFDQRHVCDTIMCLMHYAMLRCI